jgi:hypothetical protein
MGQSLHVRDFFWMNVFYLQWTSQCVAVNSKEAK